MTIKIKKGESKKSIDRKLSRLKAAKTKGFPANLFTGKIKFEGDPVAIQRKMRDEWE
jgi:hypothetical protein